MAKDQQGSSTPMSDDAASLIPTNAVELATELTIAWLSNPNTRVSAEDVPGFLQSMHEAVSRLGPPDAAPEQPEPESPAAPAVSVRKSLASKDYIISMIDGKPYKTLRRHLATNGLTPDVRSDMQVWTETGSTRPELTLEAGLCVTACPRGCRSGSSDAAG